MSDSRNQIEPPKSAERLLSWFIKGELLEEILGDLDEYHEELLDKPNWKRKLFYWFHVFHFLRPFAIKKSTHLSYTTLFRHTFLISFRNFRRHKSSFFINLGGLSTGLACAILVFLWVGDELSTDNFHDKKETVYQAMLKTDQGESGVSISASTSLLMGNALKDEFPEIEHTASSKDARKSIISIDEKNAKSTGMYLGKDYFKIFNFPFLAGNENEALNEKASIVISENLALQLFNTTEDVIGSSVTLDHKNQFFISGIFENIPSNSTIQFDFGIPLLQNPDDRYNSLKWTSKMVSTFIVLKEGTNLIAFNKKVKDFLVDKSHLDNDSTFLRPFSQGYLYGNNENVNFTEGRISYVVLFASVGFIIMLMACINFTNLSIARASRRATEIGVKKSMGVSRKTLIQQFLGESIIIALLSLLLSFVLILLFLPQFNEITGKELTLTYNIRFYLSVFAITLLTGFMAGIYPALYLSRFNSERILKKNSSSIFSGLQIGKALLVFQCAISTTFIVVVFIIYKQMDFIQNKDLGYERDNIVYFDLEGESKNNPETFITEIKKLPGIESASSAGHNLMGSHVTIGGVKWSGMDPNTKLSLQIVPVNYGLLELLKMEMKEGRAFDENRSAGIKVIFNEEASEL